jgi:hypothetical protein
MHAEPAMFLFVHEPPRRDPPPEPGRRRRRDWRPLGWLVAAGGLAAAGGESGALAGTALELGALVCALKALDAALGGYAGGLREHRQ